MKKRHLLLSFKCWTAAIAATAVIALPALLHAAPVQIKFAGIVTRINGNYTPSISVGDSVSFTHIIDLEEFGMTSSGTIQDTQWYDYFYAEQVGGLRILGSSAPDTKLYGWRDAYNNQTKIRTGSDYEYNDWWSSQESLPEGQYFYVGQYFYGNGGILYPNGNGAYKPYAYVRYNLWVDSISEVPIPGAAWLFGSVVLGLVGLRRKQP